MRFKHLLGVILAITLCSTVSSAGDFSFTGNFTNVNQVQLFTFTVTNGSTVVIQSYSYGGGANSAGATIQRGGFDPSITLFSGTTSSAVLYKTADDEYGCQQGVRDSVTKVCYDVYWQGTAQFADPNSTVPAFEPGTYTLALTNYGNSANGETLGAGFSNTGSAFDCNGNKRTVAAGAFTDCLRSVRDSHWALDIKGVTSAQMIGAQNTSPVVSTPTQPVTPQTPVIQPQTGTQKGGGGGGGKGGQSVSVGGGNSGGGGKGGNESTATGGEQESGGGNRGGGQQSGGGSGRGGSGGGGGGGRGGH